MDDIRETVAAIFKEKDGTTRLANMLGLAVTTVHYWKQHGVPEWRWPQIEEKLRTSDEFKELGRDRRAE
jgi:uncharacterized protein YjcR